METIVVTMGIVGLCGYIWAVVELLLAAPLWCNLLGGALLGIYLGAAMFLAYLVITDENRTIKKTLKHGIDAGTAFLRPVKSCFCRNK